MKRQLANKIANFKFQINFIFWIFVQILDKIDYFTSIQWNCLQFTSALKLTRGYTLACLRNRKLTALHYSFSIHECCRWFSLFTEWIMMWVRLPELLLQAGIKITTCKYACLCKPVCRFFFLLVQLKHLKYFD